MIKIGEIGEGRAIIIGAIIGALGVIIAALIATYGVQKTIEVRLIDAETGKGIHGEIFIDASTDGFTSTPENPAVLKIKRGNRVIRAENAEYKTAIVPANKDVKSLNIKMEKLAVAAATGPVPLPFAGWNAWGGLRISIGAEDNKVTVNGTINSQGGFFNDGLPAVLRGKTLVLYFANVGGSKFEPNNRMAKLTYNNNDLTLRPVNEAVLFDEYLPVRETPLDRGIEFKIPYNFDGKLGFVFFHAELENLQITAFYK
jgi:hypothetical protein